jgi:hypothetical protein
LAQIDSFGSFRKSVLKSVGGPIMFAVSRFFTTAKLAKSGFDKNELRNDPRAPLLREIEKWSSLALKDGQLFHGGDKPDLADLDLYGILVSVRKFSVFDDLVKQTSIGPWVARMDKLMIERCGSI